MIANIKYINLKYFLGKLWSQSDWVQILALTSNFVTLAKASNLSGVHKVRNSIDPSLLGLLEELTKSTDAKGMTHSTCSINANCTDNNIGSSFRYFHLLQ